MAKVTTTIRAAEDALAALAQLPALNQAPKATYALARNQNRIQSAMAGFHKARKQLWVDHFGHVPEIPPEHPKKAEFMESLQGLLDEEIEVEVRPVTETELNLEINAIAPSHLAALSWMINWEEDDPKVEVMPAAQ